MSQTNINFLKLSFERALEEHSSNLTIVMRQFEPLMSYFEQISKQNLRLKKRLIILEANCSCPVQQNKPPRYKKGR